MKRMSLIAGLLALQAFPGVSFGQTVETPLQGIEETPAIITNGTGTLRTTIAADNNSIAYELSYSNLEAQATVAHIHVGQRGVAGGVAVFLCGGGGKPACPATSGTVSGSLTAADVIGPVEQGIQIGQFDRLLQAVRAGVTYGNVHSTLYPEGEIRGQIVIPSGSGS